MINEEVVEEVLQGHLDAAKWAIPRQTKIYICSTRGGMYTDLYSFYTQYN